MAPRTRRDRCPICPTSDHPTAIKNQVVSARAAPYRRLRHFLQQGQPFPHPLAVLSEIIMAIPRSAVDRNARTIRSEFNELDGDDVGKAEGRRMLDEDEPSVVGIGHDCLDTLLARYHFCPIFAQSLPWHGKTGRRWLRPPAISRRTEEKTRFRKRRVQLGKADCLARSQAIFGFAANIDPHSEPNAAIPSTVATSGGRIRRLRALSAAARGPISLCHREPLGKGADRNGIAINPAGRGGYAAHVEPDAIYAPVVSPRRFGPRSGAAVCRHIRRSTGRRG